MLQCLIKKSSKEVLWRQDSPNHRNGKMKAAYVKLHGGDIDDLEEVVVSDMDKEDVFAAKQVYYDASNKRIKTILYTPEEREERREKEMKAIIKNEMIQQQIRLNATKELGFETTDIQAKLIVLKEKFEGKPKKNKDKVDVTRP